MVRIVIIEDEKLMAEDLAETIQKAEPAARIEAILCSVKESVAYFSDHTAPDIIFSDIQLGDGLSFDIFRTTKVKVPVVFCTAYDEYALDAFKANGIDYILKPFPKKAIAETLRKYKDLKEGFSQNNAQYEAVTDKFKARPAGEASVLVYIRDKILPVQIKDIAAFFIENEITHLVTFERKTYCIQKTLDELEKITGDSFYRANRQHLVSRKAIADVTHYTHRKLFVNLSVPFTQPVTVSKAKATEFLEWLSGT